MLANVLVKFATSRNMLANIRTFLLCYCVCRKRLSSPPCRSELADAAWVVIVPGQKSIKHNKISIYLLDSVSRLDVAIYYLNSLIIDHSGVGNLEDNEFLQSLFRILYRSTPKKRNVVIIIDEIYVKPQVSYQGGHVFK